MVAHLIRGDARMLPLATGSVQAVVCSPPFYGLRAYGTRPVEWGGDSSCNHDWIEELRPLQNGGSGPASTKQISNHGTQLAKHPWTQATCARCRCWRGELGSEPTAEMFTAHLVEVFREVKRVLRDDGVCFVNLGSSYSGSGKGPTGKNGIGNQTLRQGFDSGEEGRKVRSVGLADRYEPYALRDDLSPKDLAYVLSELAAAFRQRSEVPKP